MLISDEYKELNRKLHKDNENYGTSGKKYVDEVLMLAKAAKTDTILDYGCGKQTLKEVLPGYCVNGYDPCIHGLDAPPEPHDLVVCTDVLEHIEPESLDEVLDDLKRVTRKYGYFVIATRPAVKKLSDGRNAHLIQKEQDWWIPKIVSRFNIIMVQNGQGAFAVMVKNK